MSDVREYWEGSTFVVEWTMVDLEGDPIVGATVTGTVNGPDGTDAAMTITADANVYRATYTAAAAGRHGWRLESAGAAVDAREGSFTVQRSVVGLPPIETDPTTDIGRVRLLATDVDEVEPLFTDTQIEALLAMEGDSVKKAAALALETIAVSEVLVSKVIRTQDLQTDGAKVAAELRARAKTLREQAGADVDADEGFGLDIVDFDPYAAYRELL